MSCGELEKTAGLLLFYYNNNSINQLFKCVTICGLCVIAYYVCIFSPHSFSHMCNSAYLWKPFDPNFKFFLFS